MTENNNKSQFISYGNISFNRVEKQNYFSYSITKKIYDKTSNTFKIDGMITLNRFADLSIIKYCFKQCIKQDINYESYSFKNVDNIGYICCKTYELDGEKKQQFLTLKFSELLNLFDLIDRVLAIYIKPGINK